MKSKSSKKGKAAKGKARSALASIFTSTAKPSKIIRKAEGGTVSAPPQVSNMMYRVPAGTPMPGGTPPARPPITMTGIGAPTTRITPPMMQGNPGSGYRPPSVGTSAGELPGRHLGWANNPERHPGYTPGAMPPGRQLPSTPNQPVRPMGASAPSTGRPQMAMPVGRPAGPVGIPRPMAEGGEVRKGWSEEAIRNWKRAFQNWAKQGLGQRQNSVFAAFPVELMRKRKAKPTTGGEDPGTDTPPPTTPPPPAPPPPTTPQSYVVQTPGNVPYGQPLTGHFPIYTPPRYPGYAKGGLVTRKPKKYI